MSNEDLNQDEVLEWAVENGFVNVVKAILEGENGQLVIDIHAGNGRALRTACARGHAEVVKVLLDAGADARSGSDWSLRIASERGHAEVVKMLLDAGADVHTYSDTALRWASERGHVEVVRTLLERGANVRACDDRALLTAAYKGHIEVVKMLLKAGANIGDGFTKERESFEPEIVQLLDAHLETVVQNKQPNRMS